MSELTKEQREELELIERCDPSLLVAHIRNNTAYDADLLEKAFALAKEQARVLLAGHPTEQNISGAEDAARYRWLRRQAVAVKNYAGGNPNWEIDWALRGESFDAAIDVARKATAPRTPAQDGAQ